MPPGGKAGGASSAEQVIHVDPLLVYFTFSRIRPRFSCGRTIASTLQQFRDGELQPRDLPLLSVLTDGTHYYSQNNRRLYTYKQLRQEGLMETVPVRLRPLPQTKRMHSKYTPESCALTATLMRDTASKDASERPAAVAQGGRVSDDGDASDASLVEGETAERPTSCCAAPPPQSAKPRAGGALHGEASACQRGAEQQTGASRALLAPQQGQQLAPPSTKAAARRQGRRKGGGAAKRVANCSSSTSSSSDGHGRGGANDLAAELRKLGLDA